MPHRPATDRKFSILRRLLYLLPVFAMLLAPLPGIAQDDDEEEEAKPQKEWVIGYALAFLPMAGAMYFMFRMNKRHEFKLKKTDDEE